MKLLAWLFKFMVVPLGISLLIFAFLQQPLYSGKLNINRDYNSVTIVRDEYGIPSIKSKTFRDTLYGLGFAQGTDRLWQIFIRKLAVEGRLSEVLGEKTVEVDKMMRTLSFYRYAEYN